jgi:uncharacterized protein (TIGR02466 family)
MVFDSTLYNDGEIEVTMPIGVPFLYTKAIEDEELLQKQKRVAEEIVADHPDGWGANWAEQCGSWNSTGIYGNILSDVSEFEPIIETLSECVDIFSESMGINIQGENIVVRESWLNANPPGNVQECHIHSFTHFAFVYYIYVPGGGNFVLDNPLSYEWPPKMQGSPYQDSEFEMSAGDLIMFPTNVEHHTTVNTSDEFRYSLAFNVGIESYIPPAQSSN